MTEAGRTAFVSFVGSPWMRATITRVNEDGTFATSTAAAAGCFRIKATQLGKRDAYVGESLLELRMQPPVDPGAPIHATGIAAPR